MIIIMQVGFSFSIWGYCVSRSGVYTIKAAVFEGQSRMNLKIEENFLVHVLPVNEAYDYIDFRRSAIIYCFKADVFDRRDYPEEAVREALLIFLVHAHILRASSFFVFMQIELNLLQLEVS